MGSGGTRRRRGRTQGEHHRHHHEQAEHDRAQRSGWDEQYQRCTTERSQEAGREGDARHAPVHEAGPGIAEKRRARSEDALPLVGPERQRGRQASREQRRKGDEPAAAPDGVHRPGQEGGQDEE